jgi:hypothetical protein
MSMLPMNRIPEILKRMDLNTSQAEAMKTCFGILAIMSREDANKTLIAKDGMEIMLNAMTVHIDRTDVQEAGCDLLWSLAFNSNVVKEIIAKYNGAVVLVRALKRHSRSADFLKSACGALSNICQFRSNQDAVALQGGLQPLVGSIHIHQTNNKLLPFIFDAIASIIVNNEENARGVSALGIIPIVITSLNRHKSCREVVKSGCHTLAILSDVKGQASKIAFAGGVPIILTLLDLHPHYSDLHRVAAVVLLRMLQESHHVGREICCHEGVRILLNSLEQGGSQQDTVAAVTHILYTITNPSSPVIATIEPQLWMKAPAEGTASGGENDNTSSTSSITVGNSGKVSPLKSRSIMEESGTSQALRGSTSSPLPPVGGIASSSSSSFSSSSSSKTALKGITIVLSQYSSRRDVVRAACRLISNLSSFENIPLALDSLFIFDKLFECVFIHSDAKDVLEASITMLKLVSRFKIPSFLGNNGVNSFYGLLHLIKQRVSDDEVIWYATDLLKNYLEQLRKGNQSHSQSPMLKRNNSHDGESLLSTASSSGQNRLSPIPNTSSSSSSSSSSGAIPINILENEEWCLKLLTTLYHLLENYTTSTSSAPSTNSNNNPAASQGGVLSSPSSSSLANASGSNSSLLSGETGIGKGGGGGGEDNIPLIIIPGTTPVGRYSLFLKFPSKKSFEKAFQNILILLELLFTYGKLPFLSSFFASSSSSSPTPPGATDKEGTGQLIHKLFHLLQRLQYHGDSPSLEFLLCYYHGLCNPSQHGISPNTSSSNNHSMIHELVLKRLTASRAGTRLSGDSNRGEGGGNDDHNNSNNNLMKMGSNSSLLGGGKQGLIDSTQQKKLVLSRHPSQDIMTEKERERLANSSSPSLHSLQKSSSVTQSKALLKDVPSSSSFSSHHQQQQHSQHPQHHPPSHNSPSSNNDVTYYHNNKYYPKHPLKEFSIASLSSLTTKKQHQHHSSHHQYHLLENWPNFLERLLPNNYPGGGANRPGTSTPPVGNDGGSLYTEIPLRMHLCYESSKPGGKPIISRCPCPLPYPCPPSGLGRLFDHSITFESEFESGNLHRAVQIGETCYDLLLRSDIHTPGHTQWFYYAVSNTHSPELIRLYEQGIQIPSVKITFNLINFTKPDSLFNLGMRPVIYSAYDAKYKNTGWIRSGTEISYRGNNFARSNNAGEGVASYYTLSFTLEFHNPKDTILIAYSYPYTMTDYRILISEILSRSHSENYIKKMKLCSTLSGEDCDILVITDFTSDKEKIGPLGFQNDILENLNNATGGAGGGGGGGNQSGTEDNTNPNLEKTGGKRKQSTSSTNKESTTSSSSTSNASPQRFLQGQLKPALFLSGRVHPGETPASWMMKGIIEFLTSDNTSAKLLRKLFVFFIVPILNPDGVIYGNNRCSLAGVDLNRQWKNPIKSLHPTIYSLKAYMLQQKKARGSDGVLMYIDLHGHSRKYNVFMYGCDNDSTGGGKGGKKQTKSSSFSSAVRVFPKILSSHSLGSKYVSFNDCSFNIKKGRESTARVVVSRELNILNSFTLEATFCGSNYGPLKNCHLNIGHLQEIGAALCDSVLQYAISEGYGKNHLNIVGPITTTDYQVSNLVHNYDTSLHNPLKQYHQQQHQQQPQKQRGNSDDSGRNSAIGADSRRSSNISVSTTATYEGGDGNGGGIGIGDNEIKGEMTGIALLNDDEGSVVGGGGNADDDSDSDDSKDEGEGTAATGLVKEEEEGSALAGNTNGMDAINETYKKGKEERKQERKQSKSEKPGSSSSGNNDNDSIISMISKNRRQSKASAALTSQQQQQQQQQHVSLYHPSSNLKANKIDLALSIIQSETPHSILNDQQQQQQQTSSQTSLLNKQNHHTLSQPLLLPLGNSNNNHHNGTLKSSSAKSNHFNDGNQHNDALLSSRSNNTNINIGKTYLFSGHNGSGNTASHSSSSSPVPANIHGSIVWDQQQDYLRTKQAALDR